MSVTTVRNAKARVLIVEDSRQLRETLAFTLRLAGFEVIEALEGEQALRMLRRHDIDIAVVDLFMPAMDGFELIREMRYTHVPVRIIAMTGVINTGGAAWHDMAHKFGADVSLVKPFSQTQFLSAVKELALASHHQQ